MKKTFSFKSAFLFTIRGIIAFAPTASVFNASPVVAQDTNSVAYLTNVILTSDDPDTVEGAFCQLLELDEEAAEALAVQYTDDDYELNSRDVTSVNLEFCATTSQARIYTI